MVELSKMEDLLYKCNQIYKLCIGKDYVRS